VVIINSIAPPKCEPLLKVGNNLARQKVSGLAENIDTKHIELPMGEVTKCPNIGKVIQE
jgi:hypothetical protein